MANETRFKRLDGRLCGERGVQCINARTSLPAGTNTYWPRNDKRVGIIISNAGDTTGAAAGLLEVRPIPDVPGYTTGSGHFLQFGGNFQCDPNFPWMGAIEITCRVALTYVQISELEDAG